MNPDERSTDSGIEIRQVYEPKDLDGFDPAAQLGEPGAFPYTRGVQPTMYRGRLWTMRQYAGFGTAEATNERFKFLLTAGQTGLSCAFDLPTQMGFDADHPRAEGEVGRVGVAISSLDDMRRLLAGCARRADGLAACEPRRSRFALAASHLIFFLGANAVTRHDGVLSVRAGFVDHELGAAWPGEANAWRLAEYDDGLFTHCFCALRGSRSS